MSDELTILFMNVKKKIEKAPQKNPKKQLTGNLSKLNKKMHYFCDITLIMVL